MPKDGNKGCAGKHLRYKVIFYMKLPLSLKIRKHFNACISRVFVLQHCVQGLDLSNLKIKSEDFNGFGLVRCRDQHRQEGHQEARRSKANI